jgi:hypothetical protein
MADRLSTDRPANVNCHCAGSGAARSRRVGDDVFILDEPGAGLDARAKHYLHHRLYRRLRASGYQQSG